MIIDTIDVKPHFFPRLSSIATPIKHNFSLKPKHIARHFYYPKNFPHSAFFFLSLLQILHQQVNKISVHSFYLVKERELNEPLHSSRFSTSSCLLFSSEKRVFTQFGFSFLFRSVSQTNFLSFLTLWNYSRILLEKKNWEQPFIYKQPYHVEKRTSLITLYKLI